MKPVLFFDTETSGLPLFNEPSQHEGQPHIVQLGARLLDIDSRQVISTLDVVIRPDGWSIPADVAEVHGITTERALEVGVSESLALGMLLDLWSRAAFRVAHNQEFDARIVRIAQHRFDVAELDEWQAGSAECTARLATPIMKLPPTERMRACGRTHPKTPKLAEAYRFFTGRELKGAHSALVDVDACIEVYFAIKGGRREQAPVVEPEPDEIPY